MSVRSRLNCWKCWILMRGKNRSARRKTSRSKGENQQQTQPRHGVDARIWTLATLVGGECSHHYATLARRMRTIKRKNNHYSKNCIQSLSILVKSLFIKFTVIHGPDLTRIYYEVEPLATGVQASPWKWNLCSKSSFTHPLSGEEKNDFKTAICKFKLLMLILVLPILIMYEIFYIFCYLKSIWWEKLLFLIMSPENASYTDPGNPPLFCPDTLWRGRSIWWNDVSYHY